MPKLVFGVFKKKKKERFFFPVNFCILIAQPHLVETGHLFLRVWLKYDLLCNLDGCDFNMENTKSQESFFFPVRLRKCSLNLRHGRFNRKQSCMTSS